MSGCQNQKGEFISLAAVMQRLLRQKKIFFCLLFVFSALSMGHVLMRKPLYQYTVTIQPVRYYEQGSFRNIEYSQTVLPLVTNIVLSSGSDTTELPMQIFYSHQGMRHVTLLATGHDLGATYERFKKQAQLVFNVFSQHESRLLIATRKSFVTLSEDKGETLGFSPTQLQFASLVPSTLSQPVAVRVQQIGSVPLLFLLLFASFFISVMTVFFVDYCARLFARCDD